MKNILSKMSIVMILNVSLCFAVDGNPLSTSYKHSTLFRNGYHDSKIATDMFQITFEGNEFTSKQLTIKYALIRAAEITKNNNGAYFVILDKLDDSSSSTPYIYRNPFPWYRSSNSLENWIEYFSIGAVDVFPTKKPSFTLTIKIFKEKPSSEAYLDATDILEANKDVLAQRKK